MQNTGIATENEIALRSFVECDAGFACSIEFDPEVKKYLWLPQKTKEQWISDFTSKVKKNCYPALAIIALPEKNLAGRASINASLTDQFRRELVIVLAKPFWGRGVGRIVALTLINRAFKDFGANTVTATVHPDNKSSVGLLHALGFVQVGNKSESTDPQSGHLLYELTTPPSEVSDLHQCGSHRW